MIYFPKKVERLTASLRFLYQKFISINGIKNKYLKSLKKIYEFEAIAIEDIRPINPEKLCGEILTAVFLKRKINFLIDTENCYLINKKVFIALLLNICITTNYLEIIEIENRLVFKGKFKINYRANRLLKFLKVTVFKEIKSSVYYLLFNFPKTEKESEDFEQAYYLLQNPLSVINLYLSD